MRVNATVAYLTQLAGWFGGAGLVDLKESKSLSKQVLGHLHRSHTDSEAGLPRAFVSSGEDGEEFEAAKLRLKQIRQALKEVELDNGIHLELMKP
jgi:hypothetical protein